MALAHSTLLFHFAQTLIGLVRNAAATADSINAIAMHPYFPCKPIFLRLFPEGPLAIPNPVGWLQRMTERWALYAKFVNWKILAEEYKLGSSTNLTNNILFLHLQVCDVLLWDDAYNYFVSTLRILLF